MRSRDDNDKPEAAPEQSAPAPAPAPSKSPGLTLEERVARLEQRLVPIIGEL